MTAPRERSDIDAALLEGFAQGGLQHGALRKILDAVVENLDTDHGVSSDQLLAAIKRSADSEQQMAFDYLSNLYRSVNPLVSGLAVHLLESSAPLAGGIGRNARRVLLATAKTVPTSAVHVISLAQDDDSEIREEAQAVAADRLIAEDPQIQTQLDSLRRSEDPRKRSLYFEILADARLAAPSDETRTKPSNDGESVGAPREDVVVEAPPMEATAAMESPAIEVGDSIPDHDGLLSSTSAVIARRDPRMLVAQVRDVRSRMARLSDDPEQGPTVQQAAHVAEASLATVLGLLDGDIEAKAATPVLHGLNAIVLDLAELGLTTVSPQAAVAFKATRMILVFIGNRWRIAGLGN